MKNHFFKTLAIGLFLLAMPARQFAQIPYVNYADEGIILNFHEIDNIDFRLYLLYSLGQDDRFTLTPDVENGVFIVNGKSFESFYNETYTNFALLSKEDRYELVFKWKECVSPSDFASIMMDVASRSTRNDNDHCIDSHPFCTTDIIQFDASSSTQQAEYIPDKGCLGMTYNPSWYHMKINTPGQFIIHMEGRDPNTNAQRDIDFCIWGPFTHPTTPCTSQLTTNKIIDCSYSGSYSEDIYLGYQANLHHHGTSGTSSHGTVNYHVPETGEYYILLITNFSCDPCRITFTKTANSGPGETDCGILPGIASNTGPYCVGDVIALRVNSQDGATYSWTGPNGFTSTQQNPQRPNCTMDMAGTYTCVTTVGTQSVTANTEVQIHPRPTANFTATSVCKGESTQFTNSSTTNPSNQSMTYLWNFGDGQTSTLQNPTHTFATAGTHSVSLTVSTGGSCSSTKTNNVTVNALPVASFTATTACLGEATQFTSTSTTNPPGQTITSYLWNFGDGQTSTQQNPTHTFATAGNHDVSLTVSLGNCTSTPYSIRVPVSPLPVANFTATTACLGSATQFTNTSTAGSSGQTISGYQWDFGDGETSTEQNPSHTYASIGTFEVTLTVVTAENSCSDSKTNNVTVIAQPTADFTATTVCQGDATVFTDASTTNPAGQAITSYLWDFGDGETSTEQNPTHTYASAGDYTVTLTVDVNNTCNSNKQNTITVYAMPQAEAGEDQTANYGDQVQLHGSAGVDGEFNYHWEPADKMVNPDEQHATTKPLHEETTFTLTVTHPQGNCSTTDQVTVLINGSDMTASVKATPSAICLDETSQLMITAVGGTGNYTYLWSPATGLSSPNSANPTAHPTETTTYSCDVSDGYTTRTLSVTVTVNYPESEEFTQYICPDESFPFNGTEYSDPGDYTQYTTTSQGCEKTITLHLFHYPTYDNAHITHEYICSGESYPFHGHNYSATDWYPETLQTIHGCDSIVWLDLTVYPPNDTTIIDPTICTSQTYNFHGRIYNQDGVIDYFDTIDNHGCLKVEKLILSVGPYQMPPKQYQYECYGYNETPSYYWDKTRRFYTHDIETDTILPDPNGGCDIKYRLDLKFHQEFYQHDTVVVCDDYPWPVDGMHYNESTQLYKRFTSGGPNFECDSIYVVDLTVNHSSTGNQINMSACNDYTWDFGWNNESYTFTESGVYTKTIETSHGCDSIVTLNLTLDYSPTFPEIKGRGFVVGGSEFQYTVEEYYIQTNGTHHTTWELTDQNGNAFNKWDIVPFGDSDDHCYLYIYTFELEPILLIATTESTGAGSAICGENFSKTKRIHCGNYGTDEIMQRFFVDVFPNPNDGNMTLSFTYMEGDVEVTVYNLQGTQVDQFHVHNGFEKTTHTYNTHKLAPGVYFINMAGKEGSITKKVVIIK